MRKTDCPASATRSWIVTLVFATLLLCLMLVHSRHWQDTVSAALLCILAMAAVNFGLDTLVLKVYARPETGLDWQRKSPSWERTWLKFLGLLASLAFVGGLYWLFPEYKGTFYHEYWIFLRRILPWWLALAAPYFYFSDARQTRPEDGYYQMGLAVSGQFRKVDRASLWQHVLGWLVKGYFMPLMFTYFTRDLGALIAYNFSSIQSFRVFFDFGYDSVFLIDVGFCCVGYLMSLRVFDTHLRWAEPTLKGWVVALFCYEPFWSFFSKQYLEFSRDYAWGTWLHDLPVLYVLWGSMILVLVGIYVWATIMFGCRFSNLTHRGILTNGPYRWTKHPAYISKNLAWWMISVPFIVSDSLLDSARRSVLLLFLNLIYFLRARTEEAHLSRDPAYVRYAEWIRENGLFRWLKRGGARNSDRQAAGDQR